MKEPINTVRLIGQVPVTDVLVMRTVCRAVNIEHAGTNVGSG